MVCDGLELGLWDGMVLIFKEDWHVDLYFSNKNK